MLRDRQVALSWDDPNDPGITGYQYSTDGGTNFAEISGSGSATTTYTVTVLSNGTNAALPNGVRYNLALRAVNASGNGGVATQNAVMVPAAPANLSATPFHERVDLSWDDLTNTAITEYQLMQLAEESGLTADDGAKNDRFGVSVAVDDDTAVVGAFQPTYTDPDTNLDVSRPGAAYVYIKDSNGAWSHQAKLTASDGVDGDEFGISVAVDGDTVVVGARGNVSKTGAIYVFTKPSNGDWTSTITETKLTATGGAAGDLFGASVALYGASTIVVGAPGAGSAYVFTKNSGLWSQKAKLTASNAGAADLFGNSVGVDDDTIAVGAYGKDGNSLTDSGLVYVFVKSGGASWATDTETVQLRASDRAANDNFGRSVAVNGNTIVVGASGDRNMVDGAEASTGSAYVFTEPATGWANSAGIETAKLTASDGAHTDQFGRSVAVDGDTIVVGAHQNDDDDTDSGSIYVFIKPANGWADAIGTIKFTAFDAKAGDRFGIALALDGDTALVAAPRKDANDDDEDPANHVADAGSAYILGISGWSNIEGSAKATVTHLVPGLTNHITYTFAVRAVNNTGKGPASTEIATPMPVPAAPLNLSAAPGDGQVALSWTDPDPEDDTITGYQYSTDYIINGGGMGNNGGASFTDIPGSDKNTTEYTVTGLANGATHTLAVRAVNDFGNSMPATVTALMVPAAPELSAAAGDTEVALSWPDPGNATIDKYHLLQLELAKLTGFGGSANDEIGWGVAIDGDTAVVGAPGDSSTRGPAYVFARVSGAWTIQATLTAKDRDGSDFFGASVALSGDTVVVGAAGDDDKGSGSGSVYVFTKPVGGWADGNETAKLLASDGAEGDNFGRSVAMDGDTVVVGAFYDDDNGSNSGSAYVFTKPVGGWANGNETAKLTAFDGAEGDNFGISVALDGDTVVVGSHGANILRGKAYVFTKPDAGWIDATETAGLTASDGVDGDQFGLSVAIDADTVVVGAIGNDDKGDASGSAYVFVKPDSLDGWADENYSGNQTAKLLASDGAEDDVFGRSVAVDGDVVLIAAPQDTDNGSNSGSAYLFARNSGTWSETSKLTEPNGAALHRFGFSVALDGNAAMLGARGAFSDGVEFAGGAYVFTKLDSDWADISGGGATTTSYRVSGLTNYQEYWFQIRAVNKTGEGPASNSASATPRIGKPDKPTGLSAKAGDKQVTLKWADPGNDTITKYQVSEVVSESRLTASDGALGDQFGISVAVDGNTAVVGAFREDDDDNGWEDSGAAYVFTRVDSNSDWSQAAKLTASDGAAGDQFGWSVGVEGDTIVVGAYRDEDEDDGDDVGDDKGSAYVFIEPSGGWANSDDSIANRTESAKLTAPDRDQSRDGGKHDLFGVSVAVDGDTVVVGAPFQDYERETPLEDLIFVGAVYVFTEPSDGWDGTGAMGTAKLTTPTSPVNTRLPNDLFGSSVAVDGDTILIGSFTSDDSFERNGHGRAYIFTKPDLGWVDSTDYTIKLTASDGAPGDWFGYSVALDGDTAVIGARLHNDPEAGSGSGAAYIFTRESRAWSEKAKLTASDAAAGDNFGYSVAVDVGGGDEDDTVVVGAWLDDDNGSRSGSAYVFAKPAIGWAASNETLKLTAPDGAANDRFGTSVAVEGEQAMVGAYKADRAGVIDSGSVYMLGIPDWEDIADSEAKTTAHTVTTVPDGTGNGPLLSNGTEYSFQIRAMNKSGYGPASDGASAKPLGKPAALDTLTAGEGDTQVRLRWTAPADDPAKAPITAYQVQVQQEDSDGNIGEWSDVWEDIPGSGATTTGYTVTELVNGTGYKFRVRPVNDIGKGDHDVAEAEPADDPPAKPTGLEATGGDGQVTLTWDDPYDLSIDKYQYTTDSGSNFTDIPDSGAGEANATSYLVRNLTNGTMYTFRIRAVDVHDDPNPDQNSVVSEPDSARPSSSTPLAPTELTATTGDMKVRLTWDDPGDSSIDEYKYSTDNFATVKTLALTADESIDAGTIEYTVIKQSKTTEDSDELPLQNGTMYTFKVWAVDNEAVSPEGPAAEVTATPLPGQPREPENLAARKGDSLVTANLAAPRHCKRSHRKVRVCAPASDPSALWGGGG